MRGLFLLQPHERADRSHDAHDGPLNDAQRMAAHRYRRSNCSNIRTVSHRSSNHSIRFNFKTVIEVSRPFCKLSKAAAIAGS